MKTLYKITGMALLLLAVSCETLDEIPENIVSSNVIEQDDELREAVYTYNEAGEYEVYLEVINRNEDGTSERSTVNSLITVTEE